MNDKETLSQLIKTDPIIIKLNKMVEYHYSNCGVWYVEDDDGYGQLVFDIESLDMVNKIQREIKNRKEELTKTYNEVHIRGYDKTNP